MTSGTLTDTVFENGAIQGDADRTYRMVTLNFIEGGGDSYPFPAFLAADAERYNRVALDSGDGDGFTDAAGEQWALAQYLNALHNPDNTDNPGTAFDEADEPDATLDTIIVPVDSGAVAPAIN